jgi:hypothetical protein
MGGGVFRLSLGGERPPLRPVDGPSMNRGGRQTAHGLHFVHGRLVPDIVNDLETENTGKLVSQNWFREGKLN